MALDAKINRGAASSTIISMPIFRRVCGSAQLYHPLVGEGEVKMLDEKDENSGKPIGIEHIHGASRTRASFN